MERYIKSQIEDSIRCKSLLTDDFYVKKIYELSKIIVSSFQDGGKLILCGNGGSAADAQHIAGELVVRFRKDRRALPAIALNTNSSVVTAIGNDFDYDSIFERQVEAFGTSKDVLFVLSTSGKSESVIRAITIANQMNMKTIGLLGKDGGDCLGILSNSIVVPSMDTPRIQESHIMLGHIICDIIEMEMFN